MNRLLEILHFELEKYMEKDRSKTGDRIGEHSAVFYALRNTTDKRLIQGMLKAHNIDLKSLSRCFYRSPENKKEALEIFKKLV